MESIAQERSQDANTGNSESPDFGRYDLWYCGDGLARVTCVDCGETNTVPELVGVAVQRLKAKHHVCPQPGLW